MYSKNLKKIRLENKLSQSQVAKRLNCSRSTYNNWEQGAAMIPIVIADKLSILYNVKLSYILGISTTATKINKSTNMNYNTLLNNLLIIKKQKKLTYETIGHYIGCTKATCQRYFNGSIVIPLNKLISISKLFEIDIDKLCSNNIGIF